MNSATISSLSAKFLFMDITGRWSGAPIQEDGNLSQWII
jgi:hypothetical protein